MSDHKAQPVSKNQQIQAGSDNTCCVKVRPANSCQPRGPRGERLSADDLTPSVIRLFLEKIKKTDTCWLWTSETDRKGYGLAYAGKKTRGGRSATQYAHRVSYALAFREVPAGLVVMHTCDTPACVHPDHLKLGTVADNIKDREAKGRGAKERPTLRKIPVEGVIEIRRLSDWPASYFAKKYGVCVSHISKIRNGQKRKVA